MAEWVGGLRAVLELLETSPERVLEVRLSRRGDDRGSRSLLAAAKRAGIKVQRSGRAEIDVLLPSVNHQGVVARCGPVAYTDFAELIEAQPARLAVLDEVADPGNLGAILRSAWAFGVGGLVIPKHRASPLTPSAVKAAAGGAEHVPVARVTNVAQSLEALKAAGYWLFGAAGEGETTLAELDWSSPTVVVLGSEGRGVRPRVRSVCDLLFRIPMLEAAGSLNVSVAAGIVFAAAFSSPGPDRPDRTGGPPQPHGTGDSS